MSTATDALRSVLALMTESLVDDPAALRIETTESTEHVVFEIHVPATDIGKLVGKQGRNIQAIRTLMSGMGAKHQQKVQVEIIEPDVEGSTPES